MEKVRIGSFDAAKAVAIFLVIWGHCIQHLASWDKLDDNIYVFIYSFHMPLFMFVAGYFSWSSLQNSFLKMTYKKFNELILPCLIWGVIIVVVSFFLSTGSVVSLTIEYLMCFWFLKSLFFCYILAYMIKSNKWIGAGIVICCLFFTLFKLNIMLPAFLLGIIFRKYTILDIIVTRKSILVVSLIMFVVLLGFYNAHWLNSANHMQTLIKSCSPSPWLLYIGKTLYRVIIGCCGTILVVSFFYIYGKNLSGIICRIGQRTLGIYVIQAILLEKIAKSIYSYEGGVIIFDYCISPLIALFVLIVCYWIILLIEKIERVRKLLLGR